MLTEILHINEQTSNEIRNEIYSYQKLYSVALRKMHSNIDLLEDEAFIGDIIDNYVFTVKNYEYIRKEVETRHKKEESIKENTGKEIEELTKELQKEAVKGKERDKKKIIKIQHKISCKLKSLNKNTTFGLKDTLRYITAQAQALKLLDPVKDKEKYDDKLATLTKNRQLFKEQRVVMIVFQGETAKNGSRSFDVDNISNGEIIFKHNGKRLLLKFDITSKRQAKLLKKLQFMAMNKELSLAIGISKDEIHITYEEGKLNGKFFDKKAFYKSIKHIKDEEQRRDTILQAYREYEKRCFKDKLPNRALSVDINPDGIGYSLIDRLSDDPDGCFDIVRMGYLDFSELGSKKVFSNKRRYEISVAIRDLFRMAEHYKACMFIPEDLEFGSNKDHGNKVLNRKVNNIWLRSLVEQLSSKWCAFYGIKKIPVPSAYSSFIGNIKYNIFDPVAASLELGRRGIARFIKGSHWIPFYHKGVITELMLHGDNSKMDYNKLKNASSWKEACSLVSTAKMSVRRTDISKYPFQSFKQNRTDKSLVKHFVFLNNSI